MRLSVSLPDGLAQQVAARAEAENRPVSNMIAVLLYAALADAPPAVKINAYLPREVD